MGVSLIIQSPILEIAIYSGSRKLQFNKAPNRGSCTNVVNVCCSTPGLLFEPIGSVANSHERTVGVVSPELQDQFASSTKRFMSWFYRNGWLWRPTVTQRLTGSVLPRSVYAFV